MRKYYLIFIFLSLTSQILPQGWFWQNPKPQGNRILDSHFLDEYNGWAVGAYGSCIKTSNGGETWELIRMPTNNNLNSVHFINNNKGYVGDWNGNLLQITDGGVNWSVQHIDDFAYISVFFIDQNYGWVLSSIPGSTYKIYKTSNGGNSWQSYLINTTRVLNDLFFLDANKGFVVGNFGEILMTTNGGVDWNNVNSPTTKFLFTVTFKDSSEGFIVGEDGTLLQTTDGGINWLYQVIGQEYLQDISFFNENNGIIAGAAANIFITSDGGTVWVNKSLNFNWGFSSCNFLSETNCIVLGRDGNIYKSTNNGDNWISKVSGDRNSIEDIIFIDYETGFTVGDAGTILRTSDRGKSWNKLNSLTNQSLESISFSDNLHGWIVGSNSTLLRTTNGGLDWQLDTIPDFSYLKSVFFLNDTLGWVGGTFSKIFKSTDGGDTWISGQINASFACTILSLSIINEDIGYACGIYTHFYPPLGIILKTTDGGLNWDTIKTENSYFNSIFFHNSLNGWVVGESLHRTFHTTDGGNNWTGVSIGGGTEIFFSDDMNGIKVQNVGIGGDISITTDSGETWLSQPRVMDSWLYSAYAYSDGFWAVGHNGTILFSDNPIITELRNYSNITEQNRNFYLSQNYPNPFNPATTISYQIPERSFVTIKVYDVLGNEIATLVNEEKSVGSYEVEFDASTLPSGVYFYRLQAGSFVETKKMVLMK